MRIIRFGVVTALLMVAFSAVWFAAYGIVQSQQEKPWTVLLPVPQHAEILPEDKVHPGTFKIVVSLEEFLQRAAQSNAVAIVTYSTFPGGDVTLKYWLSRDGSTYYYAEKWIDGKLPWHTSGQGTSGRVLKGNRLTINPSVSAAPILLFAVTFMCIGAATLVAVLRKKVST